MTASHEDIKSYAKQARVNLRGMKKQLIVIRNDAIKSGEYDSFNECTAMLTQSISDVNDTIRSYNKTVSTNKIRLFSK